MYDYFAFAAGLIAISCMILPAVRSKRSPDDNSQPEKISGGLAGSFMLIIYGILTYDAVIICGQAFTYFLLIRSTFLSGTWKKIPAEIRIVAMLLPLGVGALYFLSSDYAFRLNLPDIPLSWLLLGSAGQVLTNVSVFLESRYAARNREIKFPLEFWYFAFSGSLMMLIYCLIRYDVIVFIAYTSILIRSVRGMGLHSKHINKPMIEGN